MNAFDADWLDLREPADHAARNPDIAARAAAYINIGEAPLVVDLGCGTGSTLRAMSGAVRSDTRWRLIDADRDLLRIAAARSASAVETVALDLSTIEAFPIDATRLVTASALLDLVSAQWLEHLIASLVEKGSALYAALSYDGTTKWQPSHPLDGAMLAAFNHHQRSDKGFGPALGPAATMLMADLLRDAGFKVETAPSPWRLVPRESGLMRELATGIASAVRSGGQIGATDIDQWLAFRSAHADGGRCMVGHLDLIAIPDR